MRRAKLTCFDVLATLTEFTARSVALNYETRLGAHTDLVVLGGGGAKNPILVERLTVALQRANPRVRVVPTKEFGCPVKAIEPAAFALLAFFRWRNRLANFPATTGSRRAVCLGQLTGPG